MERNISNSQTAPNTDKEANGAFAFYSGIDLGDKHSDVCGFGFGGRSKPTFSFEDEGARFASLFHELDICKRSTRDHMNFVLNISGAAGDDALLASKGLHGWRGNAKRPGMLCWRTCVRTTPIKAVGIPNSDIPKIGDEGGTMLSIAPKIIEKPVRSISRWRQKM